MVLLSAAPAERSDGEPSEHAEATRPPPTSHERTAGRPWDASYQGETPAPWDIGRPQEAFVRVANAQRIRRTRARRRLWHRRARAARSVAGRYRCWASTWRRRPLRSLGRRPPTASVEAEFEVADAFELDRLGRTLRDSARLRNVPHLRRRGATTVRRQPGFGDRAATPPSTCCASATKAPDIGPHPISQEEFGGAFDDGSGWNVVAVEPDTDSDDLHARAGCLPGSRRSSGSDAGETLVQALDSSFALGSPYPVVMRRLRLLLM